MSAELMLITILALGFIGFLAGVILIIIWSKNSYRKKDIKIKVLQKENGVLKKDQSISLQNKVEELERRIEELELKDR